MEHLTITGQQVRVVALSPSERALGLLVVGSITGLVVGLARVTSTLDAA